MLRIHSLNTGKGRPGPMEGTSDLTVMETRYRMSAAKKLREVLKKKKKRKKKV